MKSPEIISTLLVLIFLFLSGLHWFWVFGGKWGMEQVIPENPEVSRPMQPGKGITALVASALLLPALFFLTFAVSLEIPLLWQKTGCWVIGGVFLLRAVGDRKMIGWSKKIRGTKFSKWDDRLFSPLCLFISILCISLPFSEHF